MSDDEAVVLMVSALIGVVAWGMWYARLVAVRRLGTTPAGREWIAIAPIVCGVLLFAVLRYAASHDVRDDARYLTMYESMGAAWVGLIALLVLPILGVSARDDVLERGNRAAARAIAGALVGFMLAFAGGNVGDGPGWWVVVFSSGLSTATLALLWLLLDRVARVTTVLTVDRDPAAGTRLGGFLIAGGIVLGRAAAGDWVSAAATARDFLEVGWAMIPLLVLAAVIERVARPTPARPAAPTIAWGAVPALAYVALALAYVAALGPLP